MIHPHHPESKRKMNKSSQKMAKVKTISTLTKRRMKTLIWKEILTSSPWMT
jgi:hypothetical protein